MTKKRKAPVLHLQHAHPKPFNFASAFIYAFAAVISISLGAFFYKGYQTSKKTPGLTAPIREVAPMLPPGSKVVTRSGMTILVPNTPQPAARPASEKPVPEIAETTPGPEAEPEEATAPVEPAAAGSTSATPVAAVTPAAEPAGPPPEIKPPPRKPWSATVLDSANMRQEKILPTADTTVSTTARGRDTVRGAMPEITIKGNESYVLTKFDLEKIAGWTVKKATWHAKLLKGRVSAVGFSTVTADWEEGQGPGGATYNWADLKRVPWRDDEAPGTYVIRGNGQSLFAAAEPEKENVGAGEWASVPVDPLIIQALVAGASYGLAITDEKGQLATAAAFASREDTNDFPFIEVQGVHEDLKPPGQIADLRAYAHPALRRRGSAGALLAWKAPGDDENDGQAFCYQVRYARAPGTYEQAIEVPRYRIPYPQPAGEPDQMVIEDLEPETTYTFFIRAVDEARQLGPVAAIDLRTLPRLPNPPVVPVPAAFSAGAPIDVAADTLSLRVVDELGGINPFDGNVSESLAGSPKPAATSFVWDRDARTLHLRAAQNETLSFLIGLTRKGAEFPPLKVKADTFQSSKGRLAGDGIRFYRVWYSNCQSTRGAFGWRGDALLPIDERLALDSPANGVAGQRSQGVLAEVHVPPKSLVGTYRSQIILTRDDGTRSTLNVLLEVLPLTLADRIRFPLELGAPPDLALLYQKDVNNVTDAQPIEQSYFRAASDHRCTLAVIPYLRNGTAPPSISPPYSGKGPDLQISDWSAWDSRFGGYLSGSELPAPGGGSAPLTHFILPVFENWPVPLENAFICTGSETVPPGEKFKVYSGPSGQIGGCLGADYLRAMRRAVEQFGQHFTSRSWPAAAHVWLNNGPSAQYTGHAPPWFLGAPRYRDDFSALETYAEAAKSGAAWAWPVGALQFRVSVPDVAALAPYGANYSLLSVSDEDPTAWMMLRERRRQTGETAWFQSEALPLDDTTLEIEAIGLSAFLQGADGMGIMETVGRPENWTRAMPQSVIYCGASTGSEKALPSLRLKALRRLQQDIEYLLMLQDKLGWNRNQLSDYLLQRFPVLLDSSKLTCDDLHQIRYVAQELLMKK